MFVAKELVWFAMHVFANIRTRKSYSTRKTSNLGGRPRFEVLRVLYDLRVLLYVLLHA